MPNNVFYCYCRSRFAYFFIYLQGIHDSLSTESYVTIHTVALIAVLVIMVAGSSRNTHTKKRGNNTDVGFCQHVGPVFTKKITYKSHSSLLAIVLCDEKPSNSCDRPLIKIKNDIKNNYNF